MQTQVMDRDYSFSITNNTTYRWNHLIFLLEDIAGTGINRTIIPYIKDRYEVNGYPCCSESRFTCGIQRADRRTISLGTTCHTVRDRADDFGDAKRKKFLKERNKVVQGSEHNLLYMSFI